MDNGYRWLESVARRMRKEIDSLHRMLRVLQLNLFDRRPLVELFTTPSPPGSPDPQMLLWC